MDIRVQFLIMVILGAVLGWSLNELFEQMDYQKKYEGLYLKNQSWSSSMDIAESVDKGGDWVCVNVRGMSFDRAVEVCQHEAGHEIFAEIIEKNPEKIDEVMEVLK
jgi:hypothetical protein